MTTDNIHKVIVSTMAIRQLLADNPDTCLRCDGKQLVMGKRKIGVECRTAFEYELQYEQRARILQVMRALSEQPVTLTFKGPGDFVGLDHAIL